MQRDNQIILMWGSKGGAGTTVTAAAAALHEYDHVLLVDLAGDCAAVLGVPEHDVGIRGWLTSQAEPARLTEFVDPIDSSTSLLQAGLPSRDRPDKRRMLMLADWLREQPGIVIVDAGTGSPPVELWNVADKRVLVTRADYLALRQATRTMIRPDEIVLVAEPGRAISAQDIEVALGAPVTATVDVDPVIARAVDSGLFIGHSSLNHAATSITDRPSPDPPTPGPEVDYGMHWTNVHNDHTFRLSFAPDTKELAFVDNTTRERHVVALYDTIADVDAALAGWANAHNNTDAGLDWVQGHTTHPPAPAPATTFIDGLMTPPPDMDLPTLSIDF